MSGPGRIGLGALGVMALLGLIGLVRSQRTDSQQSVQSVRTKIDMGRDNLATPSVSPTPNDAAVAQPQAADASIHDEPGCTARTLGSLHLRPRPEKKASGPQLPKDTRLRVLDKVNDILTERRGLSLYRVEVEADHTLGYAYLRSKELARECPLIWPSEANLEVNMPFAKEWDEEDEICLSQGPAKSLVGLLRPLCRKERRQLDRGPQLDVDGDGRMDRLLEVNSQLSMVRNTAAGWTADVVAALGKYSNREEVQWLKPIQAGATLYVPYVEYGWESFPEEEGDDGEIIPAERDQSNVVSLLRWLDDGRLYKVFEYLYSGEVEDCSFTGNPDQSVTLRCKPGSVRLRWEGQRRRLVP